MFPLPIGRGPDIWQSCRLSTVPDVDHWNSADARMSGRKDQSSWCGVGWASYQDKEVDMRKHVLVLTTTAAILAFGANVAIAQAPGAETPGAQQSPTIQPSPGDHGMMGDHPGMMWDHPGMMGRGMIGGRFGHHDLARSHDTMG